MPPQPHARTGESDLPLGFRANASPEVYAYIETTNFGEYLEIAQDLNLRSMDGVFGAGTRFAFPSQTTYVESGVGTDEARASSAEARVRGRRERHDLQAFPAAVVEQLRGTLLYPPGRISAARRRRPHVSRLRLEGGRSGV